MNVNKTQLNYKVKFYWENQVLVKVLEVFVLRLLIYSPFESKYYSSQSRLPTKSVYKGKTNWDFELRISLCSLFVFLCGFPNYLDEEDNVCYLWRAFDRVWI